MRARLGIRTAARPAWQRLQHALLDLDRPVPCRADPDAWTSDDVEQRAIASRTCSSCLVIRLCDAFANVNREAGGIWAGRERTPKRGRPVVQRQEVSA